MTNELRGHTAIVGVGETDYSRASGRTELMLSLQAIQAALDDAGLKPSDVDGLMKWSVDTSAGGGHRRQPGHQGALVLRRDQPGGQRRRGAGRHTPPPRSVPASPRSIVIYPRHQRALRASLRPRRRHGTPGARRGAVHGAVRRAGAAAPPGDDDAAAHVRDRRHQPAVRCDGRDDPAARQPQPARHVLRDAADASRTTRTRASSWSRCTSSTAAWRRTAAALWC